MALCTLLAAESVLQTVAIRGLTTSSHKTFHLHCLDRSYADGIDYVRDSASPGQVIYWLTEAGHYRAHCNCSSSLLNSLRSNQASRYVFISLASSIHAFNANFLDI